MLIAKTCHSAFNYEPNNSEINCRFIGRAARDEKEGEMARNLQFFMPKP